MTSRKTQKLTGTGKGSQLTNGAREELVVVNSQNANSQTPKISGVRVAAAFTRLVRCV
jgi:hypothetical protein